MSQYLNASKKSAFVLGIFLPALETVRRFHQMADWHYLFAWLDDYLLGAFLIFAAWQANKNIVTGQKYLTAAWGGATAGLFLSFAGQLDHLAKPDPAPVSSLSVAVIKGVILIFCITNLTISLRAKV